MKADLPGHVAIIMDGNGRWAKARKLPRTRGHAEGVESVRAVTRHGARRKLGRLTLYAFSEENWKRPAREVRLLMRLLRRFLIRERGEIMDNDVRLEAIGRIDRLPAEVRKELDKTREMSAANRGMVLNLALSYGGHLWIAPSRIAMAKLEVRMVGELDAPYRLKDAINTVRRRFDAIIIDTPPTLGLLTVNALVAATHVLIPIQASYFALEGTDDLLETIDKIKARPNTQLRMLGVLITMFDRRTILAKQVRQEIIEVFGEHVFDTFITKSVRLEESPAHRSSIFEHAPSSSGAYEYYRLCEEVLQRVGSK